MRQLNWKLWFWSGSCQLDIIDVVGAPTLILGGIVSRAWALGRSVIGTVLGIQVSEPLSLPFECFGVAIQEGKIGAVVMAVGDEIPDITNAARDDRPGTFSVISASKRIESQSTVINADGIFLDECRSGAGLFG